MQEALRLAKSPAGQQLLALLQNSGGPQLQQAAKHAASGDYTQAQQAISGLLENPEIQALLKQLGG